MKLYEVTVQLVIEEAFIVPADNEEDARELGVLAACGCYNEVRSTHVESVVQLPEHSITCEVTMPEMGWFAWDYTPIVVYHEVGDYDNYCDIHWQSYVVYPVSNGP